jgi:hypothetical protein
MTLNLTAVAPAKVKGNYKRMLAIYGLPTGYNGATGMFTGGEPISTYQSKWSGFILKSFENGYTRSLDMRPRTATAGSARTTVVAGRGVNRLYSKSVDSTSTRFPWITGTLAFLATQV